MMQLPQITYNDSQRFIHEFYGTNCIKVALRNHATELHP